MWPAIQLQAETATSKEEVAKQPDIEKKEDFPKPFYDMLAMSQTKQQKRLQLS
jgi:hypothetical protein